MKNTEKTNATRILESKKIQCVCHTYEPDPTRTGAEIAVLLGEDPVEVFKTLVTLGKSGQYYVFVIPVADELDLKKAARAVGEKCVSMIRQRELLPLTGYVHGGCSPVGMKKAFPTWLHETAAGLTRIYVSAGRVGLQMELNPKDLEKVIRCRYADLVAAPGGQQTCEYGG